MLQKFLNDMKYYYSLQIDIDENKSVLIDEILGVSRNMFNINWGLEIIIHKDDIAFDFIEYFIGILKDKYQKLELIGIARENISLWLLYEYEGQCNMAFSPEQLLKIGQEKVSLCISCWEK